MNSDRTGTDTPSNIPNLTPEMLHQQIQEQLAIARRQFQAEQFAASEQHCLAVTERLERWIAAMPAEGEAEDGDFSDPSSSPREPDSHTQESETTPEEQAPITPALIYSELTELWLTLGMALHQQNRLEEAGQWYQRILDHQPDFAPACNNLAVVLRRLGRDADAQVVLERAIALNPNAPEAYNNLGNLLMRQGKRHEAQTAYEKAVTLAPDSLDVRLNWANALRDSGQLREAIAQYQEMLQRDPTFVDVYNNLGNLLQNIQKYEQAIACYQAGLQHRSTPSLLNNLAAAYQSLGRNEEAIAHYQQAIALRPNYADAYYNLGNALRAMDQHQEAIAAYGKAIDLNPQASENYNNLGLVLHDVRHMPQALVCFERAIALRSDYPDAILNRGLSRLIMGELEQGFADYEQRWRVKGRDFKPPREFDVPLWNGDELPESTILLHAEQGLGDTLQFVRYVSLASERVGQVVLECQPPLVKLLRSVPGVDAVIAKGDRLPKFEAHAPLMSLPHLLDTTLTTIPATVPYVNPVGSRPDKVSQELEKSEDVVSSNGLQSLIEQGGDRLKVGIVWAGSPTHLNDRHRSCSIEWFKPLGEIPGVQLYSLQKGDREADLQPDQNTDHETSHETSPILNLAPELHDFTDTAGAIARLDLVITVDTSVAHLAGALGKPVWVLLGFASDWRWLLEREDSPWYPTARLFRQTQLDNWADVFAQVKAALQQWVQPEPRESQRSPAIDAEPAALEIWEAEFLEDESAENSEIPEETAEEVALGDRQPIGIGIELSTSTGWGIFGTNLTLQLLKTSEWLPIPLLPPLADSQFSPLHQEFLHPLFLEQQRIEQILAAHQGQVLSMPSIVFKALGNHFVTAPSLQRIEGQRDVGLIFFEDPHFTAHEIDKALSYDVIVAGSSWNAEILQAHGLTNVRTVCQGIDPTLFHPAPRSGFLGDRFVIFSGGKLEYRKGQDLVVEAFRIFQQRYPEALLVTAWHNRWPATLQSLGRSPYVKNIPQLDANHRLQLKPWLIEHGIPASACLDLGLVPNAMMGQLIREADVAVFPNRCEGGTNLAAMECLACGIPTILSANTGHLDLLNAGLGIALEHQTALQTPPSSDCTLMPDSPAQTNGWREPHIEGIVDALERVYGHQGTANSQALKDARTMLMEWSWEVQVQKLLGAL
ncbi:MAG: tetratricopeptide repeat protein [Elainellaceae cyanobacterium]